MKNTKLNADIHLGIRLNAKENELLLRLCRIYRLKKSAIVRQILKQGLLSELKKIQKSKSRIRAAIPPFS